MPKNFQTSQYDEPICFDGWLDVDVETDEGRRTFRVEIERAHMEEDTGKTSHQGGATGRIHGADYSLVDYNRAGIPLIEIVTKPVPDTGKYAPEVARAYVTALREMLRSLGVSDVKMEQGSLRCDVEPVAAAYACRPAGHPHRDQERQLPALGGARGALRGDPAGGGARLGRHGDAGDAALARGHRPHHDRTGQERRGRLPLLPRAGPGAGRAVPGLGRAAARRPPENPAVVRARLQQQWGLSDFDMASVVNAGAVDLVAATVAAGAPLGGARKWWLGELARIANENGVELSELAITAAQVAEVESLVASGSLNDTLARQVIESVLAGEGGPARSSPRAGLRSSATMAPCWRPIDEALAAQPDVAGKIRDGKLAAAGAIVGAVMKSTRGQADAAGSGS